MEGIRTAPAQGGPVTADSTGNDITPKRLRLSPRQRRALVALLDRPRSREDLDRIAGTSNSPDLVGRLRKRGITILCEHVSHTDRDGVKGWHGVYRLPESERRRLGGVL
ncbi:hypothetical protein [Microbulbifer taiwanensis]|uniref:Helix-turn-helix domain-containing protein n=1 Tax=Microbulbifer taiwanensis TaxID=986746 RepID=A0ABW1YKB0_9GAMM|nr:hypothetical protein [Microbulbifer taiwanensis]